MNELKRLVGLIAQRSSKVSPLVNQQDESSLETKLFNLIKSGKVESDEEAAKVLYGDEGLTTNYRMLKSRMRKKLFNQLHFIEFPAGKVNRSNAESCKIDATLLEAQVLLAANEYKIADKLLSQAIAEAKHNELNKKIVKALELKQIVNSVIGNKKTFKDTAEELQRYYKIEASERTALMIYQNATLELKSTINDRNAYLPKVPDVLQELHMLWEKVNRPVFSVSITF